MRKVLFARLAEPVFIGADVGQVGPDLHGVKSGSHKQVDMVEEPNGLSCTFKTVTTGKAVSVFIPIQNFKFIRREEVPTT